MKKAGAFTLVELLVVVAIIVVLLALLLPAMNKAIYQATLASCGAKLKALGAPILTYTAENKRYYPPRGFENIPPGSTVRAWINAMALVRPLDGEGYDMRPPLRPIMDINSTLQCPFTQPIELNDTPDDVGIEASYVMFWSWKFHKAASKGGVQIDQDTGEVTSIPPSAEVRHDGMFRYGDRFAYTSGGRTNTFNVLAGDIDLMYTGSSTGASHPDREPSVLFSFAAENMVTFARRDSGSRWVALTRARGWLDNNFLFDDHSVGRYDNVPNWKDVGWTSKDDRFAITALQYDQRRDNDRLQLPKR